MCSLPVWSGKLKTHFTEIILRSSICVDCTTRTARAVPLPSFIGSGTRPQPLEPSESLLSAVITDLLSRRPEFLCGVGGAAGLAVERPVICSVGINGAGGGVGRSPDMTTSPAESPK